MASQVVSVILDGSITYVNGTVNDKEYTFTLTADYTWSAEVDVAEDRIYRMTLTTINNLGTVSTFSTTLYYGLNLITERTQADVNRYLYLKNKGFSDMTSDEQAEWMSDLKGAYNYTDLSRVDAAVDYIAERLQEHGYHVNGVKTYRLWDRQTMPTVSSMFQYLENIRIIRNALAVKSTTPNVPSDMALFTYKEANDIEQILLDVDSLIIEMMQAWFYAGDVYAGEV